MAGTRREAAVVSDGRTAILGRIERALRTARIPATADRAVGDPESVALHQTGAALDHGGAALDHTDGAQAFPASARTPGERATARQADGCAAMLERFLREARALGVDVFFESTPDAVRDLLATQIAGLRVLSWNPDQLPYGAGALAGGAALGSSPRADQAAAEVGVTGCHGAIAETGSLALLSAPGCSRAVSLLPPLHVALVRRDDLFAGMGEFFSARADHIANAGSCTFITGPSRTADIELSLTIGVHGPKRVVVIVGP